METRLEQKFRGIIMSVETQYGYDREVKTSLIPRIKFYQRCLDKLVKINELPQEQALFRRWFESNVGRLQEN